jgi:hypothetical protein
VRRRARIHHRSDHAKERRARVDCGYRRRPQAAPVCARPLSQAKRSAPSGSGNRNAGIEGCRRSRPGAGIHCAARVRVVLLITRSESGRARSAVASTLPPSRQRFRRRARGNGQTRQRGANDLRLVRTGTMIGVRGITWPRVIRRDLERAAAARACPAVQP